LLDSNVIKNIKPQINQVDTNYISINMKTLLNQNFKYLKTLSTQSTLNFSKIPIFV